MSLRRFKALQNLVMLYYALGQHQKSIESYNKMLSYMGSVTRNDCTDAINAILDAIAASTNVEVLSKVMLDETLHVCVPCIKTNP